MGRNTKNLVTKKCVICKENFLRYSKARYRQSSSFGIRSWIAKTCSPKCAKVWDRLKMDTKRKKRNDAYPTKICVNCHKVYYTMRRIGQHSRKSFRPFNSITCSKKCSVDYHRRMEDQKVVA